MVVEIENQQLAHKNIEIQMEELAQLQNIRPQ